LSAPSAPFRRTNCCPYGLGRRTPARRVRQWRTQDRIDALRSGQCAARCSCSHWTSAHLAHLAHSRPRVRKTHGTYFAGAGPSEFGEPFLADGHVAGKARVARNIAARLGAGPPSVRPRSGASLMAGPQPAPLTHHSRGTLCRRSGDSPRCRGTWGTAFPRCRPRRCRRSAGTPRCPRSPDSYPRAHSLPTPQVSLPHAATGPGGP
jgi:hypothetical protein